MSFPLHVQYSSAIQAEVTQLYAMLEQDQEIVTARSPTAWDLPRYFNKLISRSCVSLCDSHQVNVTSTTTATPSSCPVKKCSTTVGWGSTSCLNCRNAAHKRLNGRGCHAGAGFKINQSSLVTLLNLAVDNGGYETIYQLLDRSLLVVDDHFEVHKRVNLVQKAVEEPAVDNQESDEESAGQELVVSLHW